jgi:predicted ATPase
MHHDGRDLAAALQTILELGDYSALEASVRSAFPGGRLAIEGSAGIMEVGLKMEGFLRSFRAAELSDGTLKYLCLLAALLSPRPPSLLAINEPDANLHPQLHEPLAELIAMAARHSQLWITTHSVELAEMLERRAGALLIRLEKVDGQTIVAGSSADAEEEPEDD